MTLNTQGTRKASTTDANGMPIQETTPIATPVTSGLGTTGVGTGAVGGVNVYDRDGAATDSTLRPTVAPVTSDPAVVESRSGGSTFTWIISAIVLIVLLYLLLQWIF